MGSVYARLGFNSDDPHTNALSQSYTSNVNTQMTILPSLLRPWQANALANNTVSDFFVNPVANVAQEIWDTSNTLVSLTNGLFASPPNDSVNVAVANVYSTSTILSSNTANSYLYITNKQSNVTPPDSDLTTPHYTTATAQGKMLSYITSQTDGVSNTSVIMGSFSSITLGNTLANLYSTMTNLTNILANSLTAHTITYGEGEGTTYYTTNVSTTNAQALQNVVSTINFVMTYYPQQDSQFFQNSSNVVQQYGVLSQFNNLGQSQNFLLNNYIGSPSLIANLNS